MIEADTFANRRTGPRVRKAVSASEPSHIKELRKLADWSQFDLAAKAGVGVASVSKFERGIRIQVKNAQLIEDALRWRLESGTVGKLYQREEVDRELAGTSVRQEDLGSQPLPDTSTRESWFYDFGLPPPQPFFGRSTELEALMNAYKNSKTRLVVITAPIGGEGKSQLANRWLLATSSNSKRDLKIFAFSFNSQGDRETRRTSSDPFFKQALSAFKLTIQPKASPDEKAALLAQAIVRAGAILYLDGIEPLQYEATRNTAALRHREMGALLRNLARSGDHFCLITSRQMLSELRGHPGVKHIQLKGLRPRAALELFDHYKVRRDRSAAELVKVARQWGYHPLSLVLLSTYLKNYHNGDIRGMDTVRKLPRTIASLATSYRPELMMAVHERRLARNNRAALQLLRILGLFDRPVDEEWITCLANPPLSGVSNWLRAQWESPQLRNAVLSRMMDLGLISVKQVNGNREVHCHALVQRYQGRSFQNAFPQGWRQANGRLFRYFAGLIEQPQPKTVHDMERLYQAVAHGCAAGFYQESFQRVYWPRISREHESFATDALGLVAEDLACLANFFERPFEQLVKSLDGTELGAHVFGLVGFRLRTEGRLKAAEFAMKQSSEQYERLQLWEEASDQANNIAVLYRIRGNLGLAVTEGERAVKLAQTAANGELVVRRMAALAEFHHYLGDFSKALEVFRTAERNQARQHPEDPFLHSTIGFRYCELLLNMGKVREALKRAQRIPVKGTARYKLLDNALALLCQGRALMASSRKPYDWSRAESMLRKSLELATRSGHRDNQIRVAIALSECLRCRVRKKKTDLVEAEILVTQAMDLADRDAMILHGLDCEFEWLLLQTAAKRGAAQIKGKLARLYKKAKGYELLRLRITRLLEEWN